VYFFLKKKKKNRFNKCKSNNTLVIVNNLYIYSLSTIAHDYTLLLLEKTISIPTSLTLLEAQLPSFIAWLWNINPLLQEMVNQVNHFIQISKDEHVLQVESEPSSISSSQESNTSKRQRQN
jgi:hypothetical protein